jgi:large repetitive protein
MRGGYRCAFFLAVLFACIQTTGCGGGSGTPVLKVTTTSLPNGVVGTAYSGGLSATGGAVPYTWAQTSGGAMPGGVTLANSGLFVGTPTAKGTFGPYVFQVTDSAGTTASSTSLSITITANALTVTTTALPTGNVNALYSVSLAAGGGTPPYTWAETSGGALPPGLNGITTAGVISGTPTSSGSYGPYVFTVTDSTNATAASPSLTLTIGTPVAACMPLGNEAALTSATPYAFLVKGTDGSGNPIDIAGSFTPNGSGGITDATVDYNGFSNGPVQMQVDVGASSYSFGPASLGTLGCLSLNFSGPVAEEIGVKHAGATPRISHGAVVRGVNGKARANVASSSLSTVQFAFSLSGFDGTVYHTGRIIESDNTGGGTNASGFIHVQLPSAFSLTSLQSNYSFGVDGWTAGSTGNFRTAIAGAFTNSTGALSAGYADLIVGGTPPSGELTGGNGTLNSTIDPTTGRGTGTYTIPTTSGNLTFDFAFYILNGSDFILLSTDSPITEGSAPLLSGRALASSATSAAGALNGYYLLASQGLEVSGSSTGNLAEIGTLNASSAGTIPTATLYVNDAGAYASTVYSNGSYTIEAASGRVSISGLTATPPVAYLTAGSTSDDEIVGFLVGTDSEASSGVLVTQSTSAPAYVLSDIAGGYAASTQEDVDGLNGATLGAFSFPGTGQYSATLKTTGSVPNLPRTGVIAINSDGSGSLNVGVFPLVTSEAVIFAIPNSGDPLMYVFTAGTPPN